MCGECGGYVNDSDKKTDTQENFSTEAVKSLAAACLLIKQDG